MTRAPENLAGLRTWIWAHGRAHIVVISTLGPAVFTQAWAEFRNCGCLWKTDGAPMARVKGRVGGDIEKVSEGPCSHPIGHEGNSPSKCHFLWT